MTENITQELERKIRRFISITLKDVKVELAEEFDRNFEREAFFSDKWARRKYTSDESRGLLMRTGTLRRSIQAEVVGQEKVVFSSDVPYAKIHNEGGTITVTTKMKKYFWFQYLRIVGSNRESPGYKKIKSRFKFTPEGQMRNNRRNRALNSAAGYYKAMALKKVGSRIIIPKRQFIGRHPDMERLLHEIALTNAKEVFTN